MAEFNGTLKEFNKYLGGYCRNKVNALSRKDKTSHNSCQYCGENKQLQAAHIKGKERIEIIKSLLNSTFLCDDNKYNVDLNKFEELFIEEHMPLEDSFYYLCSSCHIKYDKNEIKDVQILEKQLEFLKHLQKLNEDNNKNQPGNANPTKINSNYIKEDKGISKSDAKLLCIKNGFEIGQHYTFASVNKSTGIYWANPNVDMITKNWWLVLNNPGKKELHVFFIPANSIKIDKLVLRRDKPDKIDLQIDTTDFFEDTRGKSKYGKGICFIQWKKGKISYN